MKSALEIPGSNVLQVNQFYNAKTTAKKQCGYSPTKILVRSTNNNETFVAYFMVVDVKTC